MTEGTISTPVLDMLLAAAAREAKGTGCQDAFTFGGLAMVAFNGLKKPRKPRGPNKKKRGEVG